MEDFESLTFTKTCEKPSENAFSKLEYCSTTSNNHISLSSLHTQIDKKLDTKLANNTTVMKTQIGRKLDTKLASNSTMIKSQVRKKLDSKLESNTAALRTTVGKKLDIKLDHNTAAIKHVVGKKLDIKLEHNTAAIKNAVGRKLDVKLRTRQPIRKAYSEYHKEPSISPLSGVPPPNDLRRRRKYEPEIEYSFEKEAKEIKSMTAALEKEIQKKLNEYKKSNHEHLEKKNKVINQIDECQNELEDMKGSLNDILKEAHYTKEELREMREKIDEEMYRDNELSTYKVTPDPVFSQLMDLKREIDFMNNRLSFTENELKSKASENNQLKDVVNKLKESIIEEQMIESKGVDTSCQVCVVV
ncbi:hypothetical protein SteCoe_36239 [Stentor coeruleus]|uniref:Uncharacterized protein n=1 Tax=Stentor coeruleus TaxID=5963 RepID=A0A1R2AQL0_9CILI|nr:hypothetical protein SteCoe_36239 [Stentor coeruleus]